MPDDPTRDPADAWATLADRFADGAYATVKGYVRTFVMHHQLSRAFHLVGRRGPVTTA